VALTQAQIVALLAHRTTSGYSFPGQQVALTQAQIDALLAQINALKAVELSGVQSAGYGDKRTEFRSLADLRQIIGDAEAALTGLPRVRQIRMTTQADKGL
jgi:hypothetical protein